MRPLRALLVLIFLFLGTPALAQNADQRLAESALDAWNVDEARALILDLEKRHPNDPFQDYLKGHLLLLEGDYKGAKEKLAKAASGQNSPRLRQMAALAESTYETLKDYKTYTTKDGNFQIAYEEGLDEILLPYAEDTLHRAYEELSRIFDFKPELPIRLEFYPTVDVLAAVSPLTVDEIRTSGTIALCKYNRLMVTSPRDLVYGYNWLDTIAHELIHLMITKKSKNTVPIWLHEGMAKYYEVLWRSTAKPRLERHSETYLAKALKNDSLIPFKDMSPSMAKLPSQEATATAFAEVWTVIAYLNQRRQKNVAAELIDLMREGKSDQEAVSQVAGLPWTQFEPSWERYLRAQNFKESSVQTNKLLFKGKDTELDELESIQVSRARDFVWLGDQLRLKKRWLAARKEYQKAADYIGDGSPIVQGKLGLALLRTHAYEEAKVALEKPIADHPRYVILRVYLGEALIQLGQWKEAQFHLEEALTMNPFDPDVHQSLAKVYEHLGNKEKERQERRFHELIHKR